MQTLNWILILEELEDQPWDEENLVRYISIGRQKDLFPSGKDYNPFPWEEESIACERCKAKNMITYCCEEDPCLDIKKLDGPSIHCDFCLDRLFEMAISNEAQERGLFLDWQKDDHCILLIGQRKLKK